MFRMYLTVFILLFLTMMLSTPVASSFEPTEEQIKQAEMFRKAATQMGMDKMSPEQLIDVSMGMTKSLGSKVKRQPTEKEKKALVCYMKKILEIQFEYPIEEYVRFLNDEEYENKLNQKFTKKCGLDKLENYKP